jgi:hypothetical protein
MNTVEHRETSTARRRGQLMTRSVLAWRQSLDFADFCPGPSLIRLRKIPSS